MSDKKREAAGFISIDPLMLQTQTLLEFDLYIWPESRPEPVLYRNRSLAFLDEHRTHIAQLGSDILFARAEQESLVSRYFEHNLEKIIANPAVPAKRKAEALYKSAVLLSEEIFAKPDSPENFKRSENIVVNTVGYILQGKETFQHLMSLTSYDYYTYTHSVNVSTMGLALAIEIGTASRAEMLDFGIGALFHDVGKTKLDPQMLNKRGPLSDDEWVAMKRHPELGLSVINPSSPFSDASKAIILEHHERLDGSGYPAGKTRDNIHNFARIAAIVDVFDALTTRRPYKGAIDTFGALNVMKRELGNHFEPSYFERFVRLFGR